MSLRTIITAMSGLWMLLFGIPGRTLHAAGIPHDSLQASLRAAKELRGKGDFEAATDLYQSTYDASVEAYGVKDTFSARVRMDLGLIHFMSGAYEESLEACREALAAFRGADGVKAKDTMVCFFRIGISLRELGDLHRAEDFIQASLAVAETEDTENAIHIGQCHNALGNITLRQENSHAAIGHYKEAMRVLTPVLGVGSVHRGAMFLNMGVAYTAMDSMAQAVESHHQALGIFKAKMSPKHPTIGNCFVNLGEAYLHWGKLDSAERWLGKAEEFWEANLRVGHVNHVIVRYDLAALARENGDGEAALAHCQAALEMLAPGFDGSDWRDNPDPDSCRYDEALMEVWRQKAKVLAMLHDREPEAYPLEAALALYEKIADLVERIRKGFRREDSQQFLTARSLPVFEEAIALAWEKGMDGADAFDYAENSKAILLLGAVRGRETNEFAVPGEMQERVGAMREKLMEVNRKIDRAKRVEEENGQMKYRTLLRERLALQSQFESLLDTLEKEHPDYFDLKYARNSLPVNDIQSRLAGKNTTLVAYFQGDEHLYGWAISPQAISFRRLATRAAVDALCDSLLLRLASKRPLNDLPQTAFHALLAPLLQNTPVGVHLVIIRDGRLEYLPFALLQNERGDYLIQNHPLSYSPSATLYFRPSTPREDLEGYLGFAMTFPGGADIAQPLRNKRLSALPHTLQEVEAGARIFKGNSLVDDLATELDFRQRASGHQVIHLATHTLIDDRNPLYSRLLLQGSGESDGFLHTYELFGMDLDAELVVLSACNTGRGQLQRGEGMMSLSRGFAYAGCPSILMTHWTVSDRQNAALMEAFFENLDEGMPKDEALRAAQLAYLEGADEITGHPWYWAAPGLVGETRPLENRRGGGGMWWLLAGMGALAWSIWKWRRAMG